MEIMSHIDWHPALADPSKQRQVKPRTTGKTMVIDKGLGLRAFEDLLQASANHIDIIKIGFGTSVLYPKHILQEKIKLAKKANVQIMPGGTFLEAAVLQHKQDHFFEMVHQLGFTSIEVSDGTIELSPQLRKDLILKGMEYQLQVFTEYGKKCWGSSIEIEACVQTIQQDIEHGAEMVTIEGRESGVGVGIYDENGDCKQSELQELLNQVPSTDLIMWETPLKSQQVQLIKQIGADINLGNIAPTDILSLEALRRGLRSDTLQMFE
jgi:phosphosulfolactate synthase